MKKSELNLNKEEIVSKIETLNEIHERFVKSFLDIIVLTHLYDPDRSIGGYDIVRLVKEKFGLLLSPGSTYALLYSLERDGLIKGRGSRKRVYTLTDKGVEKIKTVTHEKERIISLLKETFI